MWATGLPCFGGLGTFSWALTAPRLCDGQASTKPWQGQRGGGVREKTYIVAISHPEISPQLHSLLKLTLNRPGCSRGGASGDPAVALKKHPVQPMAPGFLCTYCSCHWLTNWSGNFLHSFAFKKDLRGPGVIPLHIPGGVGGCAPSCWAGARRGPATLLPSSPSPGLQLKIIYLLAPPGSRHMRLGGKRIHHG